MSASNQKETTEQPTETDLLSHHVFLLPFKLERPASSDNPIFTADDFASLVKHLGQKRTATAAIGDWCSEPFTLERIVDYNEWEYFYDFVRDILYETTHSHGQTPPEKQFIKHYQLKLPEGKRCLYQITTPIPEPQRDADQPFNDGNTDTKKRKTYELDIDSIVLHLYYTGVGVLSFHLNNRTYFKKEDILYINQYGRRVFPGFYPIPEGIVGTQAAFDYQSVLKLEDDPVNKNQYLPHGKEIAYAIALEIPGHPQKENGAFEETWADEPQALWHKHQDFNFPLPEFLRPLLGMLESYGAKHKYHLKPVLDNRMFVVCWYGNKYLADRIANDFNTINPSNGTKPATDWWYKYVFVDQESLTVQHDGMRKELLQKASYLRWSGLGTWYGVTDYSLVLLTSDLNALRKYNASFLITHLQTIYFRLAELSLVQRACVQKFSDDITVISRLEDLSAWEGEEKETKMQQLAQRVNQLYRRYIRFSNRIYFREVTAQVQGIELYTLLHQQSRLPAAVQHINQEISDLHAYVRQETDRLLLDKEKKRQEASESWQNLLTILGAAFVAPGLVIATYDLGFIGKCLDENHTFHSFLATAIAAILSAVFAYLMLKFQNRRVYALGAVVFVVILFFPAYAITNWGCADQPKITAPAKVPGSEKQEVSARPTTEDTINNNHLHLTEPGDTSHQIKPNIDNE